MYLSLLESKLRSLLTSFGVTPHLKVCTHLYSQSVYVCLCLQMEVDSLMLNKYPSFYKKNKQTKDSPLFFFFFDQG